MKPLLKVVYIASIALLDGLQQMSWYLEIKFSSIIFILYLTDHKTQFKSFFFSENRCVPYKPVRLMYNMLYCHYNIEFFCLMCFIW